MRLRLPPRRAALALAGLLGLAGIPPAAADPVVLPTAVIGVESSYDSNVYNGRGPDYVTRITPRIALHVRDPRVDLRLGYDLGLWFYAVGRAKNSVNQLARAASQESGWAVRRVSLRERNPKAVPDDWERAALEDFDRRAAAGEKPATLERAEVVQQQGRAVMRYMRALPVIELCTGCHGTADRISPAVKERLAELYPQDKATGYSLGQIRGAMTISKPLP